jgi:hypothetical protein
MPTYNHPLVGPVSFRVLGGAGGPIEVTSPELPIVPVTVPQLAAVPLYEVGGQTFGGKIRWHRRGVAQLLAAWAEVEKAGLLGRVLTFDGALNARLIRGSHSTPSNHAFATAFDINATWNGLHVTPPRVGRRGSVRELAPIFESHGFRWGGNYSSRPDGMHFEIVRWVDEDLDEKEVGDVPTAHVVLNGIHLPIPTILRPEDGGTLYVGLRAWCESFAGTSFSLSHVGAGKLQASVTGPTYAQGARAKTLEGVVIDGVGYVRLIDVFSLYDGLSRIWDGPSRELRLTSGRVNP